MKKINVLIALFAILFSINVNAQVRLCSTDQDEAFMKRLESNVARSENEAFKTNQPRFVPVEFHLIADNDGTNTISRDQITSKMCVLNNRFADINFHFYIDGITQTKNSVLNERQGLSNSITLMRNTRNPDALNIFLVNQILENDGSPSGAAGYYSGGGNDFIVMLQSVPGDDEYTMEHEIGHYFSLSHTHYGWEGDISTGMGGYNEAIHGDTVTMMFISGSTQAPTVEIELMDMSNCTTAGDRICDTPPDYGFGQACSCCTMIYDVYDRNRDKVIPMMNNIMSYSRNCTENLFTDGQEAAMKADYATNRRAYLRTGEVTEYTPITTATEITSPENFDIYENYSGVLIEWNAVEFAEYYKVNISGAQQLQYETTDTEFYITDLRPDSPYFVEVRAFNKFGTGCQAAVRKLFDTGTGTTSINETESISNTRFYPNPVTSKQDLIVEFAADKTLNAQIRMHNIQGKVVQSQDVSFISGKNKINVPTAHLTTGVYIIKIETTEGIITEKIIVE